ncbi:tyrosine-type recombinase/integrase, partial [Staphylococcus aureus]
MSRAAKGEGTAFKTDSGWRGYVTVNGKRKYFSAKTKAEAAQLRRHLLSRRDQGELSVGKVPTLKEWLDHWLSISEHRESTKVGYRNYVENYIEPLHGVPLDKLGLEHLERLYADMESRGLSGSTRHQVHSIIRVALKHAVWRGHVGRNVAALVKPPSVGKPRTEALSEADLDACFRAAIGNRYEARWFLSLQYGLRPGEATALEWPDVDFEKGQLHVHQQLQNIPGKGLVRVALPKTAKGDRLIDLPEYLIDMLAKRRADQLREMLEAGDEWAPWEDEGRPTAFVFTQRNGQPLRPGLDVTEWQRLLDRAGLPRQRRYVARHTAASVMVANGTDIATIAEVFGHASPSFTLNTYTHALAERKKELAKKMNRLAAPYAAPY